VLIKIEMCLWLLAEGSRLPFTRIGGVPHIPWHILCQISRVEQTAKYTVYAAGCRNFMLANTYDYDHRI